MTADPFEVRHAVLVAELRALADPVPAQPPTSSDVMADAVLARLPAVRLRHRPALPRRRLVAIAAAVLAGLAALLAAAPVRAVVRDWFGFGGVHVRISPAPAPTTAPPPPTVAPNASMAQARAALGFAPLVPAELGAPDAVQVSADRRLVSMSWTGGRDGTLRLDQWAAQLDGLAAKTARGVRFTSVGGDFALWFDAPHEVVLATDDHGGTRSEPPRLAGHTLIWQTPRATLRLEGDVTYERALEIASSSRPGG